MLSADQVPVKNPHSRMQWPVWVVLIAGSTGSAPHGQSLLGLKSRAEYIAPTAGVIDSQSVKTTEAGGPRGFDAGKKIKGRKRHLLTDTAGFLIAGIVHEASTQDRDGAPALFKLVRSAFPWLRHASLMVAMRAKSSKRRSTQSAAGPSKSSNDPMLSKASSCCHVGGLSREPSHGLTAIVASQRISRPRSKAPKHGS